MPIECVLRINKTQRRGPSNKARSEEDTSEEHKLDVGTGVDNMKLYWTTTSGHTAFPILLLLALFVFIAHFNLTQKPN